MKGEHSTKCDECKRTGSATFSRIFYKQIKGRWKWLCKTCWGGQENRNDFKGDILEDLKILQRSVLSADRTKQDFIIKDLAKQINKIIKKFK